MPEVIDSFSFDKGSNWRKSAHVLSDGEMARCYGFNLNNDGELHPLTPRASVGNTVLGKIRNIHRHMNWVYVQEGSNLKYKNDLNGYCDLYVPPDDDFTQVAVTEAKRCRTTDYKTWTFVVNGLKNIVLNGANSYDWAIQNPTTAPGGAAGASGSPNGTYTLFYTFLVKFPNGEQYETGPSPSNSVVVSAQKIEWSGISTCPYSGTGLVIYRKLYRYSATLTEAYWVTDISNNTDTTYSDDLADASINTNDILVTNEYGPAPDDILSAESYIQRIFAVKDNYLYWSEPYLPFNFKISSAIAVSPEGDNLTGCVYWGDTLYLPSKVRWRRLVGSDPDTWSVKEIFADKGVINPDTIQRTKYGILGLWYDGVYLFDGSTSKNITEKIVGTSLFTDTITDLSKCYATYDGSRYYFYWASLVEDPCDCMILDFSLYPEIRMYNDPLLLTAQEYHSPTGIRYMAYEGYQYEEATVGTAVYLRMVTGEKVGKNILQRKNLKYLYYDIDTGGLDVTATIYIDGTAQTPTFTINTSTRTRDRIDLPNFEGYRLSLQLATSAITGSYPIIYAPWAIQSTTVGV